MKKRLALLVVIAAFVGSFTVPVHGQSALIQAALQTFIRVTHTWGATQTFTNLTITGTCTGCGTVNSPVTVAVVQGGSGTTSTLTLQPTSGVGTTGADVVISVGTNGGTEVVRALNNGRLQMANGAQLSFPSGSGGGIRFAQDGGDSSGWTLVNRTVGLLDFSLNATPQVRFGNGGINFGTTALNMAAGSPESNAVDTGLARSAAAVVKVTNGSSGTGSLILSTLRGTQTTVPTCTSNCGTSPAIVGSDTAGVLTMGASGVPASGFVITFNGTWAGAPSCVVQSALTTMAVGKMPIAVQVSTTTITVTTNGTAPGTSDKYSYLCIGVQ